MLEKLVILHFMGKLNSSLPCDMTYSQAPRIRMWTSLWGYYSACTIPGDAAAAGLGIIL